MTRLSNLGYHEKYSATAQNAPRITVYFLQASRSIRTVWLLEELGISYELEFADRIRQKAPQDFKDASENPLGKFPTIKDKDLVVYESGAITEYLCDHYDVSNRLIPDIAYTRAKVQMFIHAAEGTLAIHALAILYFRWNMPQSVKDSVPEALAEAEAKMGVNVVNAMNWLESEIDASTGRFLVGDQVTAADCMVMFSVQFIIERDLGIQGQKWPKIEEWLKRCEGTETYQRAVSKSGYTLHPKTT